MDDTPLRWKPLPVQIIRAGTNVILKRGCTEIRFRESKYADHLALLLESCRTGATEGEILCHFEQADQPTIQDLVSLLQAKSILVPTTGTVQEEQSPQSPLEVFYWHFEHQGRTIVDRLESRQIVLLGDNILSKELDYALATSGFRDVITVEYPAGTKRENAIDHQRSSGSEFSHKVKRPIPYEIWLQKVNWKAIGCFVATSDFGGRVLLREWNELAVRNRCHFLPVVLQNVIGYIGPLVVPGEAACYECLIARENSHLDDADIRRTVERAAYDGQHIVGFHPLMISVLASVAAFELLKFYSEIIPVRHVGTLLEVNLLSSSIRARKVLKIPRCAVCSSMLVQPSVSIHKPITESETASS